jgi:hypothetical protein
MRGNGQLYYKSFTYIYISSDIRTLVPVFLTMYFELGLFHY